MPAGKHRGNARGVQKRIEIRHCREPFDCSWIRGLLGHSFHISGDLSRPQHRVPFEITPRDFVDLYGEGMRLQTGQRTGQMIDRVVRAGDRAMPAGVQRFELKIHINFFTGLNSRGTSGPPMSATRPAGSALTSSVIRAATSPASTTWNTNARGTQRKGSRRLGRNIRRIRSWNWVARSVVNGTPDASMAPSAS